MRSIIFMTSIIVALCFSPVGEAQTGQPPRLQDAQLVTHIEHDGVNFSIAIDNADNSVLSIGISRRSGSYDPKSLAPIHLKVKLRTDRSDTPSVVEGQADMLPGVVMMAGSDNFRYRFSLKKRISLTEILSVEIRLDNQTYSVFMF